MDDEPIEIGFMYIVHPQWWFSHDPEYDEALRVGGAWSEQDLLPKRRQPDEDDPGASDQPVRRLTMTVEEAAEALGISRAFAYEAVNRGDIPSIRIGRRILVPKIALERMINGEAS